MVVVYKNPCRFALRAGRIVPAPVQLVAIFVKGLLLQPPRELFVCTFLRATTVHFLLVCEGGVEVSVGRPARLMAGLVGVVNLAAPIIYTAAWLALLLLLLLLPLMQEYANGLGHVHAIQLICYRGIAEPRTVACLPDVAAKHAELGTAATTYVLVQGPSSCSLKFQEPTMSYDYNLPSAPPLPCS